MAAEDQQGLLVSLLKLQEKMEDLLVLDGQDKPPKMTKITIEAVGAVMGIQREERETPYRATLNALLKDYDACMQKLRSVDVSEVNNVAADKLFTTTRDPCFDPDAADSETLRELCLLLVEVMEACLADPARKPILQQKFVIAVDGSRMSYPGELIHAPSPRASRYPSHWLCAW